MQFTYLGTAAAEGWPAVFCRCKYCLEAQRLGGKNIRTRSQAIVNDDLLIDLPPDTYLHKLAHGPGIDLPAELDLCFDLIALCDGHLTHIVAEAHDLHVLRDGNTDGGLHPAADCLLYTSPSPRDCS